MCQYKPKLLIGIITRVLIGVIIAAVVGLLLGFVVMWLWNWLMPAIFGLTVITFWQAWGLVLLSHILFKSFPHHGHSHYNHDRMREHFKKKFMQHHLHPENKD